MDYGSLGSSVHGIFQERILKWVAIPFSRGSSRPRDWTHVFCISCIAFLDWVGFFTISTSWGAFSGGAVFKAVLVSAEVRQWQQQPSPVHPALSQGLQLPALAASQGHPVPLHWCQLTCFGAFISVMLTNRIIINLNNKISSAQTEEVTAQLLILKSCPCCESMMNKQLAFVPWLSKISFNELVFEKAVNTLTVSQRDCLVKLKLHTYLVSQVRKSWNRDFWRALCTQRPKTSLIKSF